MKRWWACPDRSLTIRTCNFGVNTRLEHRTGIIDSFIEASLHEESLIFHFSAQVFASWASSLYYVNFLPCGELPTISRNDVSCPLLYSKFLSHKSCQPRHFIRALLAKTIELRPHLLSLPFLLFSHGLPSLHSTLEGTLSMLPRYTYGLRFSWFNFLVENYILWRSLLFGRT